MENFPMKDNAVPLEDAVIHLEALRDVKDLQRQYSHLRAVGDIAGALDLFAPDAVVVDNNERHAGRVAIGTWLQHDSSPWLSSTTSGLYFELADQPVVTLSTGGTTATGRWLVKRFLGNGTGTAVIESGVYENTYALRDGRWFISMMKRLPFYAGEYREGWCNVDRAPLPIYAYSFSPNSAGCPTPHVSEHVETAGSSEERGVLWHRLRRLNIEDDIRNLQNACGYYFDRRMWSDVEQLLSDDCELVAGSLKAEGRQAVRGALDQLGSEMVGRGELNDYPIFGLIVDVDESLEVANCRFMVLGLHGNVSRGEAGWGFYLVESVFRRDDVGWRISKVAAHPLTEAPYDEGWGFGDVDVFAARKEWSRPLVQRTEREVSASHVDTTEADTAELLRCLRRSRAFDAVENISGAYGYFLDDFQWRDMATLFAREGHKQTPFVGFYRGPERIFGAAASNRGGPPSLDTRRERLVVHWRPQNVILVSHDGRSATLRTRLFQCRTAREVLPNWTGIHTGAYANDQAVLEDGVWRLWSVNIDEYYVTTSSWRGGWTEVAHDNGAKPPESPLLTSYPPDIPLADLGERARGFRGGPGEAIEWPDIPPMWFHYKNPISGRTPEHYWPDCIPAEVAPEWSMTAHGYELPDQWSR